MKCCNICQVNTLSKEMNEDLEAAMNAVESDSSVRAAVLVSSKKGNFIAGADINMLGASRLCSRSEIL